MKKNIPLLIFCIVLSELAGSLGSIFTVSAIPTWYATLAKPALNPPNWIFGPVWFTLYFLIGVSLFLVWKRHWKVTHQIFTRHKKSWNRWSQQLWLGKWQTFNIVAIFIFQYVLNILWSVVFFSWHSPMLAFFTLGALWIAIIYTIVNFYRVSKLAAWLLLPYLLWVSFAGYLNWSIWMLN